MEARAMIKDDGKWIELNSNEISLVSVALRAKWQWYEDRIELLKLRRPEMDDESCWHEYNYLYTQQVKVMNLINRIDDLEDINI